MFPVKSGQMLGGVHIYNVWRIYGGLYVTQHIQEGKKDQKTPDGAGSIQLEEQKILNLRKRQF